MKKFFLTLILMAAALGFKATAQQAETLFPYPQIPDGINTLSERCNYLVYHFWDRANIKQSFSTQAKLNAAFGDWLGYMPYATVDTVMLSIDNFIASVEKTGAKNLLIVGKMAENWLASDTAEYKSEQLYLPFCKAVAENKKIDKAERARFASQLRILQSSSLGAIAPKFEFVKPDGTPGNFGDAVASRVILFFNDPDCFECTLTKTRLSADYNTNQLLEMGLIKIVSIYPGEPTDEWKEAVASYPELWIVGAAPDIDLDFDIPKTPTLYYLDGKHKILGKYLSIDAMLYAMKQIHDSMTQPN